MGITPQVYDLYMSKMSVAAFRALEVPSRSKFGNKVTEYKGVKYHSKKEAHYAMMLDALIKRGEVLSWQGQVSFPIVIGEAKICTYICDFVVEYSDGRQEVVDVKGFKTDIYRLKKKLVEALFDVRIIEV